MLTVDFQYSDMMSSSRTFKHAVSTETLLRSKLSVAEEAFFHAVSAAKPRIIQ